MQNTIFKSNQMNDIQNYLINNKLENVFRLTELELIYTQGQRYTFFMNDKIIESFEVDRTSEVDEHIVYQYILGFLDSYIIMNRIENNSQQSRLTVK